ncbi:MAG TPA: type II toxin-antitoxin system PemK/MazF family toxin [Acidimicrobiales bacterium]|nr:type II toxin-antitoxin system PemK/MazF family toxin [Acidimicrobiales bacterium]
MESGAAVVRGEVWWASTAGGDRPVLVMTRDPVADRIGAVVVAPCTRTIRGLSSELPLDQEDGMPERCVANFDTLHTLRRSQFRRRLTRLSVERMEQACRVLAGALGCP